ncbi:MAG: acyltransferase family protein [Candidatus Hodarchaeota archaeon]
MEKYDSSVEPKKKRFYLISVDILQGLAIFPMIFGHSIGWWNSYLSSYYETGSLAIIIIMTTGILVFPCYLYLSGFNQVNSILRKRIEDSDRKQIVSRTIKRSAIFFLLASISMVLMSIVSSPGNLSKTINYLFTWHLFHMFAFSALFILILFEISCLIQKNYSSKWKFRSLFTLVLLFCFLTIIFLFFFFHEYTVNHPRPFPVDLNIRSIFENIFLDVSSCGIVPWLSFSLAGGITASYLNLPNLIQKDLPKKAIFILLVNLLFLTIGFLFLGTERFVSAGIGYASSFSHVFISIGLIGFLNISLILFLDIYQVIPQKTSMKVFTPLINLSKISLTVYFIHPVFAILNPNIISSEIILLIIIGSYCLFFIFLSSVWKKWYFKYSFEWFIRNYS